ncbi:netrin-4-like [Latimeria chalumnae]|uniref:netrin-4-like n=1 Tax=Latimeria chalumnae TaxID=7897 RepID=UPI00313BDFC4
MDNWVSLSLIVVVGCLSRTAGLSSKVKIGTHCENKACNPRMGNLALGRRLVTDTTCGHHAVELFCDHTDNEDLTCRPPRCDKCSAAHPHHSHPPTAMSESSFQFPNSWWQSAPGVHRETIQLDFETEFYFTHLILVFKTPRPAAMILEKSQDFGKTWRPSKYFATSCNKMYGLADDVEEEGAVCTSRYSRASPCTRGEVIYRALSPPYQVEDPYSLEAQDLLKVTNIRVQLLKQQQCPCQGKDPDTKPHYFAHYSIYHFIAKGSCLCNGHADHCLPADGFKPSHAQALHVDFHTKLMRIRQILLCGIREAMSPFHGFRKP